ncbi:hypothetical protein TIFTF001_036162 [Ficus carica]|uniref:Uncharacterized protein n=1 Tax=Ficus carica TaxID=3494 RepID=A0AA88J7B6_FICCA|nr:hypothetical protein TIFTF001_036120 [Ficus carica]GMN67073.1 hypothetical protein TIFTF001_036137 [Ficus carica]GMN67081.1 hypothetical protein TIFTF001_036147 [Ficus carica]GMN67098.1 hypothetical protein TIFTF001_036162 [Ficus carica]
MGFGTRVAVGFWNENMSWVLRRGLGSSLGTEVEVEDEFRDKLGIGFEGGLGWNSGWRSGLGIRDRDRC